MKREKKEKNTLIFSFLKPVSWKINPCRRYSLHLLKMPALHFHPHLTREKLALNECTVFIVEYDFCIINDTTV